MQAKQEASLKLIPCDEWNKFFELQNVLFEKLSEHENQWSSGLHFFKNI